MKILRFCVKKFVALIIRNTNDDDLWIGQPKVNEVKNFVPILKFMKYPQTKFHAHIMRES